MIEHKSNFGVYHWDTFDNETILIADCHSLTEAEQVIQKRYAGRISSKGADKVEIVDKKGNIRSSYSVK